jgi:hypothetical protein
LPIGSVSSFGSPLDGREILVISVTVSKEKELIDVCPLSQVDGMLAEEFP